MKNVRFGMFVLMLAGGVAFAVSSLLAQSPAPRPAPEPRDRARMMMLDNRGSQIGVMVQDLTADELEALRGVAGGVRIADVDQDSPASKAGLREGDVVVELDGEKVRSSRQFSRLVQETVGGRVVKLGIVRNGEKQTVDVTPDGRAFSWGLDSERIGRDIARGMRDFEPRFREIEPRMRELGPKLRALEPKLREFRLNPPGFDFDFDFDFDGVIPGGARGRLGVQIESLSPQLGEYFGVKDGGVLVSSVTKDSPAEKAGLKAGDVITTIDGDRVREYDDLISELRGKTGEVTLGIVRDKKEMTLKATIDDLRERVRRPQRPAI